MPYRHVPKLFFLKIETRRHPNDYPPSQMPTISNLKEIAPYYTDLALLQNPTCPAPNPYTNTFHGVILVIYLLVVVCFVESIIYWPVQTDNSYTESPKSPITLTYDPSERTFIKRRRSPRLNEPLTNSVHALLTTEGQTVRSLLAKMALTNASVTKSDINSSLYKLKAQFKAAMISSEKGAPRWTLPAMR